MNIDTEAVLEAAGTKWNFLPFRPGLVGGHCIGVDPYYLTHKAQSIGHNPQVILAGRRQNDSMGAYVANQLIGLLNDQKIKLDEAKILVMGLTFKENCPDLRNTRVVDVISKLEESVKKVDVWDPWVDPEEALKEYGISIIKKPRKGLYDGIVVAVGHDEFKKIASKEIHKFGTKKHVLYDLKYILSENQSHLRL
jgi:UDP-N-acetyl-D-galactosamine dehydrogenase